MKWPTVEWPAGLATLRWLMVDTFRQSLAYGLFWVLLGVSGVSTLVCLTARVENSPTLSGEAPEFLPAGDREAQDRAKVSRSGVALLGGEMTLGFGSLRVPLARDARRSVHLVQLVLAGGVADTLGFMLAIIWTAGFLPAFLEPRAASVLLSKRTSRAALLWGKYLGVLAFVLLHATVFVLATWLALGVRTGVWDASYLWCVPLLLLHFGVFFAVSTLLAVWTGSTVTCVFGSILFWVMCWSMNYGHHALALARGARADLLSPAFAWAVEAGYWILPKPADLGALLYDAVGAEGDFPRLLDYEALTRGGFSMALAVVSSVLFAAMALWMARHTLELADY